MDRLQSTAIVIAPVTAVATAAVETSTIGTAFAASTAVATSTIAVFTTIATAVPTARSAVALDVSCGPVAASVPVPSLLWRRAAPAPVPAAARTPPP